MTQPIRGIRWQMQEGESVKAGGLTLTPQSRALSIGWRDGGWVWNRPVGVLVQDGDSARRLPITDVTRLAQIGLWGLSFAFLIASAALSLRGVAGQIESRRA